MKKHLNSLLLVSFLAISSTINCMDIIISEIEIKTQTKAPAIEKFKNDFVKRVLTNPQALQNIEASDLSKLDKDDHAEILSQLIKNIKEQDTLNEAIIKLVKKFNFEVNGTDSMGLLPIGLAAIAFVGQVKNKQINKSTIETLLKSGASPFCKNNVKISEMYQNSFETCFYLSHPQNSVTMQTRSKIVVNLFIKYFPQKSKQLLNKKAEEVTKTLQLMELIKQYIRSFMSVDNTKK